MAHYQDPTAGADVFNSRAALKLARKRARDRRAQQGMRDRTRNQLEALQLQVARLSQQLRDRGVELDDSLDFQPPGIAAVAAENIQVREENEHLRCQLAEARRVASCRNSTAAWPPPSHGIMLDSSILESWSTESSRPVVDSPLASVSVSGGDNTTFPCSGRTTTSPPLVLSKGFADVPWNVAPTCPADCIMQPFFEEQRRLVLSSRQDSAMPGTGAEIPATMSAVQVSISKVAADLLATYSEFDQLPKKVACLYVISSILNVTAPSPPLALSSTF